MAVGIIVHPDPRRDANAAKLVDQAYRGFA